jgi:hypothetical protein
MTAHHDCYRLVQGDNHEAFGAKLGEAFKATTLKTLKSEQKNEALWEMRKKQALKLLPITREYYPEYIRELEAYAEAIGTDFETFWTLSLEDEIDETQLDHCTSLVTPKGLAAHNEDWNPGSAERLFVLESRIGVLKRLELYYEGTLGGCGMTVNPYGVMMVNTLHHADRKLGIPKHVIARKLSEIPHDRQQIQKILRLPRHAGYAHSNHKRSFCSRQ